jgi:hypothetical protein
MLTNQVVRVAVTAVFPIVIFPPHTHRLLAGPLEFAGTPWAAAIMAVLIALALPRVLDRPLPRDGGRSR